MTSIDAKPARGCRRQTVVFTTGADTPRDRARWARRIAARYTGEAVADRYAARNAVPGELLVRLVPDEVVGRKGVAD